MAVRDCPQLLQKRAPGLLRAPQLLQKIWLGALVCMLCPQFVQKALLGATA
jgi:hypothetical protein